MRTFLFPALLVLSLISTLAGAQSVGGAPPGTHQVEVRAGFDETVSRLEKAVAANGMGVVSQASASRGGGGSRRENQRESGSDGFSQ